MANKLLITTALTGIWVAIGIGCTMWIQGLHFITAAYVVVQILTTIGYGDIPVSSEMHWFMTFYVILGLCVAANAVNDVFSALLEKSQEKLRLRMLELEEVVRSKGRKENKIDQSHHELNELLAALCIVLVFVLGGALFYMLFESCTCSYGVSQVANCVEDTCETTDGSYQKDFAKSIYMSVITLITVGFGDFTPRSQGGRVFGLFWMIAGVLAFANFVTAFGAWIDAAFKKDNSSSFGKEIFDNIDKDGNGFLTRSEFMSWLLIKEGLVTSDQVDHCYSLFDTILAAQQTTDGTEGLEFDTLSQYFHEGECTGSSEDEELLSSRDL